MYIIYIMRFSVNDRYEIAKYVIDVVNSTEIYRDLVKTYSYWKEQIKNICLPLLEDEEWKLKFYRYSTDFGEYEVRSIFDTIFKDIGRFVRSQTLLTSGSSKKSYVYKFKHINQSDLPIEIQFN